MKTEDMGENKEFMADIDRLLSASGNFAHAALRVGEFGAEKIVAMTAAMTSLVTGMGMICGGKTKSDDIASEQIMFASILVGHMIGGVKGNVYSLEFTPEVLFDAMEAYQRMTGNKIDRFLAPGLVAIAREAADGADVPLAEFMASREKH